MAKTDDNTPDEMDLEAFFEAGRAAAPVPSQDLLARIMADADAALVAPAPLARPAKRPSIWAIFTAAVGGWPSLAGMATAAVAGVWLGVAQPAMLSNVTAGMVPAADSAFELESLVAGYDSALTFEETGQ